MFEDILNNQPREYNMRLGQYPQKIDEISSTLVYVGYAQVSAADPTLVVWKIKKIEKVGTVWEIRYADGDELYDNVWDNRFSINYK
jgi:hypothetical protein